MAVFAYLRVSTLLQDTDKNKLEIINFATSKKLGSVEFIEEHVSGRKNFKERKIGKLLNNMQSSDILIVPELSRLARSITQILEIINITKQKGIIMYSLKENFCNNEDSLTATVTSTIFALGAQIERELISLRTREALIARKAKGVKLGRPKGSKGKSKLDVHAEDIKKLLACGVPKTVIARTYNTSTVNLYSFLKKFEVA